MEYDPSSVSDETIKTVIKEGLSSETREGKIFGLLGGLPIEKVIALFREAPKEGLGAAVKEIFERVQFAAKELDWRPPVPIYAGIFPTGSFNAQAVAVSGGVLLLINTGLMMLIYQSAKLFMLNARVLVHDDNANDGKADLESQMSRQQITEALADIVLAYLFRGASTFATRYPMETGVRGMLAMMITDSAEFFVVAHEYGHAVAGHLTSTKTIRHAASQSGVSLDFVAKDWEQEVEADIRGLKLLIPPSKCNITTSVELDLFRFLISGPFFFFALDELISGVSKELRGIRRDMIVIDDHPPSRARFELLRKLLKEGGAERAFGIVELIARWFDDYTGAVCEHIRTAFSKMGHELRDSYTLPAQE